MSAVTIRDGVATITTPTRRTEVHLADTAQMFVDGLGLRPSKTDLLALSTGYLELEKQVDLLQAELKAARSGTIGVEHATAIQEARNVLANINKAAGDFMEEYDKGDGPSGVELRDALGDVEHWLLRDVNACFERAKVLKVGAA